MRRLGSIKPLAHGVIRAVDPLFQFVRDGRTATKSDIPVTAVIPMHPKDIGVAGLAISYLRRNLLHPLEDVVVVARDCPEMRAFAKVKGCRFIDEESVLGVGREEIRRQLAQYGFDYWGWIFQQLLKLGVDAVVEGDHFLILDADTLLLKPRAFKQGNTLFQQFSHERNPLYHRAYHELTGLEPRTHLSYVCHHMFAERRILSAFREHLERHTGTGWIEAITDLAAPELWSAEERAQDPFNFFSEYESYGNFCRGFYEEVSLSYFFNRGASDIRPDDSVVEEYLQALPKLYCWASFHDYYYREAGTPPPLTVG